MSIYNSAKPEPFGEGQSVIDVTEFFDSEEWHETGDGLNVGYQQMNLLEEMTLEGEWDVRYMGSGHNLGLYRDADSCYWELRLNEAQQSYRLHYIGTRQDVMALIAQ